MRVRTVSLVLLIVLGCSDRKSEAPRGWSAAARAEASGLSDAPTDTKATSIERRIIRKADVSLEVPVPQEAQRSISALAVSKGGYVVSSDVNVWRNGDGEDVTRIDLVFRVPAATFDATLEALRGVGTRVAGEKITGEDVTEEYVDVEARLRAQKAVEAQYLKILEQAKTVKDTLEVQEKLGAIRTEIEVAEGRRRFLDDQTRMATFTVHLARELDPLEIGEPGFLKNLQRSARDAVEVGIGIINGLIRFALLMVPVTLLLLLPAFWILRAIVRRSRRRPAPPAAAPPAP